MTTTIATEKLNTIRMLLSDFGDCAESLAFEINNNGSDADVSRELLLELEMALVLVAERLP